ncbi:MAG: hypothetical protein KGL39_09875 [Patescibacteria group bacterium]|nr:hypothetical protein [Patescibacteria group bacterium]
MSTVTPETQAKIAIWRQKAVEGTLTVEEMKEAIHLLRAGRIGAHIASDTSRRKKAKADIPSADDLLAELGDI